MRDRCIAVIQKIPEIELIIPDKPLTSGGLVRKEQEAKQGEVKIDESRSSDCLLQLARVEKALLDIAREKIWSGWE